MNEKVRLVRNRQFWASLTNEEYIQVRVLVAQSCTTLKAWVTEAIQDKLNKIGGEGNANRDIRG